MTQLVSALRVTGTVLLGATELALVALFAVAVAADNSNVNEMGCLLLHCAANVLVWANEVYAIARRGDIQPKDLTHVIINAVLVIITAVAFGLFAFYLAETGSQNGKVNFATLGAPVAYVVLILSWLVTMLAIQSLVFAGADKYHAYFGSGSTGTTSTRAQEKSNPRTPKRNKNNHNLTIDITRRPLPLTIINVVQNGQHELYRNPNVPVAVASHPAGKTPMTPKTAPVVLSPLADNLRLEQLESAMRMETPPAYRTTYNHWSGTTL